MSRVVLMLLASLSAVCSVATSLPPQTGPAALTRLAEPTLFTTEPCALRW